jgi:hypothetical protein
VRIDGIKKFFKFLFILHKICELAVSKINIERVIVFKMPAYAFSLRSKSYGGQSGGEGNRTPVQTYSTKAFYMLISILFVGNEQETNKPIQSLAA